MCTHAPPLVCFRSRAMDYRILPLSHADELILWDMLYQALHTSEGAPPPDVVKHPDFARYVEGWGREGDSGFVARDSSDQLMGAVWSRSFSPDEGTVPELAFAVRPGFRRRGIGAALLTQFVKANPAQSTISIRAHANNPAVRLYERFGYKVIEEKENSVTMRRDA
jgi:ribosomal protein S18 acetylase RimI-like enzyme